MAGQRERVGRNWKYEVGGKYMNWTRKIKKREPEVFDIKDTVIMKKLNESKPEVMVHGFMWYKCETCGKEWRMWLEKGIEEHGENHKPSPFMIRCKCGGTAKDISGIIKLPGYRPVGNNMSYFANKHDSDCGVPVIK